MWFSAKKRIYLDYASATPVLPEALNAMRRASALFGNPGAIHAGGVAAEKSLENSRERIARELACKPREVIFTSGGTEGNNLAILGLARKLMLKNTAFSERGKKSSDARRGESGDGGVPNGTTTATHGPRNNADEIFGHALSKTHWVVSSIEHPSVLECFSEIERLGGKVSHVDPDEKGIIRPEKVLHLLKPHTKLVSIGWANHEIGVVQPIRDIARVMKEKNPETLLHVDAGQAPLYLSPQVHTLGVDLFTLDAGKMYGPRGIGALYISNRMSASRRIAPIILGGGQERGLRAGTENVALAAGFAEAFALISKERGEESHRLERVRDNFAREIVTRIPGVVVNGDLKRALPHMLNISIPEIQSEYVTLALDAKGISISTKSACREGEERRSHVVEALGDARDAASAVALAKEERAANTLRFSLGRGTTARDIGAARKALMEIIAKKENMIESK